MHVTRVLLAAVVLGGCSLKTEVTEHPRPPTGMLGKEGAVGFTYKTPTSSCTLACAIMPGSDETVLVDPSPYFSVTIESSDPTVLTATPGTRLVEDGKPDRLGDVTLKGVKPGQVEVRIKKATGELLDRIDVSVAAPATVTLKGAATTVKIGQLITLEAIPVDASGKAIEAYAGWEFSGDAEGVGAVSTPCAPFDRCFYGAADVATVKGIAAGTVNVTAKGGGIEGKLAVTVTP